MRKPGGGEGEGEGGFSQGDWGRDRRRYCRKEQGTAKVYLRMQGQWKLTGRCPPLAPRARENAQDDRAGSMQF